MGVTLGELGRSQGPWPWPVPGGSNSGLSVFHWVWLQAVLFRQGRHLDEPAAEPKLLAAAESQDLALLSQGGFRASRQASGIFWKVPIGVRAGRIDPAGITSCGHRKCKPDRPRQTAFAPEVGLGLA